MQPLNKGTRCGLVAILGRPNVGKSTLLNAILGERIAAVSPKAQTTRRRFRGIRTDGDTQMIFVDTPGLHRAPKGKVLNEYCVAEALDASSDADVYVYVIDGSREYRPFDKESDEYFLLRALEKRLRDRPVPLFVVLNKLDEWQKGGRFASQTILEEAIASLKPVAILPVSAKKAIGVEELVTSIAKLLPAGPFLFPEDELTDQNLRTIVGELIQEQLFWQLGAELPYSCAVEIERYSEPGEGRKFTEIDAVIHVDRESQKPMVLGKGGAKIKEIGRRSRESIEKLLGAKVVLKTFVKVSHGWTKDARRMTQLGYVLPEG